MDVSSAAPTRRGPVMLPSGTRLGTYRIIAHIGVGGMGEVYQAKDLKLGRDVAVKTLHTDLSTDPEHVTRFEREARAASSLNHPNITTLFDFGEHEGTRYIAMELVHGETLRALLDKGPLPLDTVLEIGAQVSEGLAKAHASGIIHRDLKPENLMLTTDGFVKILDFGLAKLVPGREQESAAAAATSGALTQTGVVLGTFGYMSPEQASGEPVDSRSDLFSLGAVLYELATGVQPFAASSPPLVFDAILNKTPEPASIVNPNVPPALESILEKALEKDPRSRYRCAGDLQTDLKQLRREVDSARVRRGEKIRWKVVLAGLLASSALAVPWLVSRMGATSKSPAFAELGATVSKLTSLPGVELFPALTSDGRSFVYTSAAAGNSDVYLRRVGGENVINLTLDSAADDTQPALSPDGELIAFHSTRDEGGVFLMGSTGENTIRLTDFGYNPSWSPDGQRLVVATEAVLTSPRARSGDASELWVVDPRSRDARPLYRGDAVQPDWSPHGYRIAFWAIPPEGGGQRDIWTIASDGTDPVVVTDDPALDWNPVWSPDGRYLYFSSDRGGSMNLWRVPIDERSGAVRGALEPVTTGASGDNMHLSFSDDGKRMTYVVYEEAIHIMKVALDPSSKTVVGEEAGVTSGSVRTFSPDVSPDGESIVYRTIGGREDLVIRHPSGRSQRLLDDGFNVRSPRWSVNDELAFMTDRSGEYAIWTMNTDGSGLMQLTTGVGQEPVWSADGSRIAYHDRGRSYVVRADIPSSEQAPLELPPFRRGDEEWHPWAWSPDGNWLAGHITSAAGVPRQDGLAIYSFESGEYETVTDVGRRPRWLSDSRTLVFEERGRLFAVDRVSKIVRELLSLERGPVYWPVPSPDDRALYFVLIPPTEADVWLLSLS